MDLNVFRVCSEEFTKLSALSDEEKEFFRKIINQQASFDAAASKGGMDAAAQAAHRDNTQRLQHFLNKKKDDSYKIPDWAKDLNGKPSTGARSAPGPGSYNAPRPGGGSSASSAWDDFMRNAWGGGGEGGWRERAEEARQRSESSRAAWDAEREARHARWTAEDAARNEQWARDGQKSRRTGGSILGGMLGAPIGLIAGDMASTHLRRKAREKGEKSEAAKYLPLIGAVGGGALGAYAGYKFSSVDLSQVFLSRPK